MYVTIGIQNMVSVRYFNCLAVEVYCLLVVLLEKLLVSKILNKKI